MVLLVMGVELNEGDQTTKALSDAIAWASSERILPKFASVLHFRQNTKGLAGVHWLGTTSWGFAMQIKRTSSNWR